MQFRQSFMEEGGRLLVVGGQVGRAPEEGYWTVRGRGEQGLSDPERAFAAGRTCLWAVAGRLLR